MKFTTVVCLILLVVPYSLQWGQNGHEIVAQIASTRLTARAQSRVSQMIGSKTLEEISTLPDDYAHSTQGKWSAPCHYADLPTGASKFEMKFCPDFCVVKSVDNYTDILHSESNSVIKCNYGSGVEPCALEFLVHFVGDIHQPLHVGWESDLGGNTVKCDFFGKSTNLHSVWDTSIIMKWNPDVDSAVAFLQNMIKSDPTTVNKYLSDMDPLDWADESHDLVESTVYDYDTKNGVAQIDEDYYNRNLPLIWQRLIAASVRLAQAIEDNI